MPTPPRAEKRPFPITRHGDTRIDPYYWLMDRANDDVLAHLRAENDYLASELAPLKALEEELFLEIKSRVEETDISVPVRKGNWWYFERTREGLNYPISSRVPTEGDDLTPPNIDPLTTLPGEQVILDENVEAGDSDFLSVGVLALSPDESWVAVGTDFDGDERHHVTVRPLSGQDPIQEELDDVYYGFAWATDSRHFFYTRVDDAMRPWQLWRHELGTPASSDVLVIEESDPQYNVSVGRSRDDQMIVVMMNSSMTSEVRFVKADDPTAQLRVLEERRQGIEYGVEHFTDERGRGWWLKVTNEGATDFRLLARPVDGDDEWREIIPERAGSRLDGIDAFQNFLAISVRENGCAALRLVSLLHGDDPFGADLIERSRLVEGGVFPDTVAISANPNFETSQVRVMITSLTTPRLVADVVVDTGEVIVRKQQQVLGGYEESQYVTGRLWVEASDRVQIPVSVVARRDLVTVREDGALEAKAPAPLLLYGYGSYEISIDPTFSSLRLSLLDRGIIFVIAHIRGGGEMGRSWYEMGRLAQKPTTFSDFVAVSRFLVDQGWTSPSQLAARGGSAGGLLMGAVMNLAPELYRAIVAEVPFVDVVTTMLDESLPLTAGEWEEWGNPDASATSYRTMKSYSPYDNVREAVDGAPVAYPHLYASGGLNDSRVGFWEPAKWVLRLRDANPDNHALLKTEMGAGHGGPSGRYDAWRDEAQVLAWVLNEITPDSLSRRS